MQQEPIALMPMLQAYKEQIKAVINGSFKKNTKSCVANIIIAGDKILLLRRSLLDDFHPGTWCLPGGGVNKQEAPVLACIRETQEEAGLCSVIDYTIKTTWTVKLPTITIYYYCSTLNAKSNFKNVILDNNEHVCYQWCSVKEWMQMNLILDLKQHLIDALI